MAVKSKTGNAFDFRIFVRLMGFAKKYRLQFWVATISTITLALFSAASPVILMEAIDDFSKTKNIETLWNYTLLMLVILLIRVALQFLFVHYSNWVGQHIIKDIRIKIFKNILNFKMTYFDTTSVGKLVTRVVSDIQTIASFFSQGVFVIVSDVLKMLVVIVVMLVINWKLALIAFSVMPVLIYATRIFQIAIKETFQEVRNQVANLNGFVQERVTGMKIVQLFNREKIEYNNFLGINNKHKEAYVKTVWYYSIFFPVAEILSSIAIGMLVWYGGLEVIEDSRCTIASIIGFIQMSQMLFRPLRQIADKFNQLQMGIVAGERVFDVMDTESFIDNNGTIIAGNIKGDIEFKDVRFSYIKNEEILKGISFNVKQGQTVAIVGATGAGKSTIINLINRFYEIDSGEILVDKVSVKEYTLATLRDSVAIVLQDVFLFSDTIYNNITLKDNSISLNTVKEAAKQIGIHDFIMSLPKGYDYVVKERGVMLSSGQRQLIAFLRAYVSSPSVLILDEATSSVDSYSEKLIQYATEKITQERTSIVIAHRLATIKNADLILVMDNGKIVERGSHKQLLKNQKGYYKELFDKQFTASTT